MDRDRTRTFSSVRRHVRRVPSAADVDRVVSSAYGDSQTDGEDDEDDDEREDPRMDSYRNLRGNIQMRHIRGTTRVNDMHNGRKTVHSGAE